MWAGFLYTVISSELSGPDKTKVSKNGIDPLVLGMSVVFCNCQVNGVDMLEELLAVFHLLNDRCHSHTQSIALVGGGSSDILSCKPVHGRGG